MTTSQGLFVRQSLQSDVPELDVDGVIPGSACRRSRETLLESIRCDYGS